MILDKHKNKKDRIICKSSYNLKKRKFNKISEKYSVNDEHINNRTFFVGPGSSGCYVENSFTITQSIFLNNQQITS